MAKNRLKWTLIQKKKRFSKFAAPSIPDIFVHRKSIKYTECRQIDTSDSTSTN